MIIYFDHGEKWRQVPCKMAITVDVSIFIEGASSTFVGSNEANIVTCMFEDVGKGRHSQ
jgi:hypothetical protein